MFELIRAYLDEDRAAHEKEQEAYTKRLIADFDEARKAEGARIKARTLEEISEGVQLHRKKIEQAMKDNEDQFVHWPHPTQPTRYGLVEHMRQHQDAKNWEPGLDF